MAATNFFDYFSFLSDTAGQMADSPKVEARLNSVYSEALGAYMRDRLLTNESEVLRSALGQFLVREGYLADSTAAKLPRKRVKYSASKKKKK